MKLIRVLIVDDSVIYRSQIKAALSDHKFIEIVGSASNGRIALERLTQMHVDLLILDLEMPELDGLQTLKKLKLADFKGKVLVFASTSTRGAEITLESLKLGATDFIAKPGIQGLANESTFGDPRVTDLVVIDPSLKIKNLLVPKIEALFLDKNSNLNSSLNSNRGTPLPTPLTVLTPIVKSPKNYNRPLWDIFKPKIVVIGASTGGPSVLEKIFSQIGQPLYCPILIVQHMPPFFTDAFAKRLQSISGLCVEEARHGTILNQNNVYVAPGDFHMTLSKVDSQIKINLDQGPQVNSVRPAVDPLFASASNIFKSECLGIVFTGMGNDGMIGSEKIKENGGIVIIQDQNSCVVFGMPGAVKQVGAFDFELSPEQIIKMFHEKISGINLKLLNKSVSGES